MLFISLLDYDVALQLYDSAREFDVRRKNYRVRQLCLLLHEGFDDLPSVLGHRFRLAVGTLPNGQLHLEKLGAAVKAITKLGKRHEQLLKQVRAEAVAHREHNALKQLEVHRLIPVDEIQSLAMEFDVQLSELNGVLILILKDLGNPAVIISHVGAALDRDRHK